jgi:hypothetical protein
MKYQKLLFSLVFFTSYSLMALDYKSFEAKSYTFPQRNMAVIASDEGYYPSNLVIFEGEKIQLSVTSTSKEPSCFILQEKGVFLEAAKGKVSEAAIQFPHAGIYKFHCPTQKIEGKVTVLEKIKPQVEPVDMKRSPAVWMPKDVPANDDY